jgi:hypothetical protein
LANNPVVAPSIIVGQKTVEDQSTPKSKITDTV